MRMDMGRIRQRMSVRLLRQDMVFHTVEVLRMQGRVGVGDILPYLKQLLMGLRLIPSYLVLAEVVVLILVK